MMAAQKTRAGDRDEMKTIAIIAPDPRYLERLTLTMQKGVPEGFAAAGFSSVREFEAWEDHIRVKALLLWEETCGGDTSETRERVLAELAGRRIPVWTLTTEWERDKEPGYVFAYQPVDQMLRLLGEVLGTAPKVVKEPAERTECRCTGVLALDGASSSVYAMQIAKRYAVAGKTLLLCVNPWPDATRDWKPGESDVSELLYLLKEYGSEWHRHERFCLRSAGNVKIISGYTCFSDYGQFTEEDAQAFLAGVEAVGYAALVIDFGASPQPALAENCESLYVVGSRSGERFATLERMLREEGLAERLRTAETSAAG